MIEVPGAREGVERCGKIAEIERVRNTVFPQAPTKRRDQMRGIIG